MKAQRPNPTLHRNRRPAWPLGERRRGRAAVGDLAFGDWRTPVADLYVGRYHHSYEMLAL